MFLRGEVPGQGHGAASPAWRWVSTSDRPGHYGPARETTASIAGTRLYIKRASSSATGPRIRPVANGRTPPRQPRRQGGRGAGRAPVHAAGGFLSASRGCSPLRLSVIPVTSPTSGDGQGSRDGTARAQGRPTSSGLRFSTACSAVHSPLPRRRPPPREPRVVGPLRIFIASLSMFALRVNLPPASSTESTPARGSSCSGSVMSLPRCRASGRSSGTSSCRSPRESPRVLPRPGVRRGTRIPFLFLSIFAGRSRPSRVGSG